MKTKYMKKQILLFTIILGLVTLSCSKSDDQQESEYQGTWSGTFSGDANGIWSALIDSDGVITGTANYNGIGFALRQKGSDSPSDALQATVGTDSKGSQLISKFSETRGAGTWINTALSMCGTWEDTRQ